MHGIRFSMMQHVFRRLQKSHGLFDRDLYGRTELTRDAKSFLANFIQRYKGRPAAGLSRMEKRKKKKRPRTSRTVKKRASVKEKKGTS